MRIILSASAILFFACCSVYAAGRSTISHKSFSNEGFFIEPIVGYSSGVLTQDGVADIGTQMISIEAQLGYKYQSFSFGLNYLMGFGTGEQFGNKGDYRPTDMGIFLKYDLPADFNVMADYILSAKTKIQSSENSGDFSGGGTRFGIAYSGFSLCSMMAEVTYRSYSKYDGTSLSKNIKDSTTSIALGFPIR